MQSALPRIDPGMTDITTPPSLLTASEAAQILRTTVANLAQLRYEGRGPEFIKLGKDVRYDRRELARYKRTEADRALLTLEELSNWWEVSPTVIAALRKMENGLPTHHVNQRVMVNRGQAAAFLRTLTRSPANSAAKCRA